MANKTIRANKEKAVSELEEMLKSASAVFVDFTGLTVQQITKLRDDMRRAGVEYRVIKNTLARFAAANCGIPELETYLKGPTAIAISRTDITASAQEIVKGAESFECLKVKAGLIGGQIVDAKQVKEIAQLPPKPVIVAQILRGLMSPMTGLANVLNANIRGLAIALKAVAEQKA